MSVCLCVCVICVSCVSRVSVSLCVYVSVCLFDLCVVCVVCLYEPVCLCVCVICVSCVSVCLYMPVKSHSTIVTRLIYMCDMTHLNV